MSNEREHEREPGLAVGLLALAAFFSVPTLAGLAILVSIWVPWQAALCIGCTGYTPTVFISTLALYGIAMRNASHKEYVERSRKSPDSFPPGVM